MIWPRFGRRSLLLLGGSASLVASLARAALPPQVVPAITELGTPTFVMPAGGTSSSSSGASSSSSYDGTWGQTDAYSTLLAQSYGAAAVTAATTAGINPDTLAAFAQIESNFTNEGNATSSADGVWQITNGTWDQYADELGLEDADRSDPTVQAQVASAIISAYSADVSTVIGQPATSAQAYGAYMFGMGAGSQMAEAKNFNAPLSSFVSSSALAANDMTGWTVSEYYQNVSNRMGSGASETVSS
jgi:hypothetical protein